MPDLDRRQVLAAVPVVAVLGACAGPTAKTPPKAGTALATLSELPMGKTVLIEREGGAVLLRRTGESEVTALSATCTHTGCTVGIAGDTIACPCHGSMFDSTGKVVEGPASEPLPAIAVTVQGDQVLSA